MTLQRLPNGRYRARIWSEGRDVPVGQILGTGPASYRTKSEAKDAYGEARRKLRYRGPVQETTVRQWWERWTTQPVYRRPKESTNIHNRDATRAFVDRYGDRPLIEIDKRVVGEWRETGKRDGTIPALRAMWNDAIHRAGLVDKNPFANLRIQQTRGNRDIDPPDQQTVWALIRAAREFAPPGFAAWLQVAAYTGLRPGELDALRWDCVDFERAEVHVAEQFSNVSRTFTLPKNGKRRYAPLPAQAREALEELARESEFCFVNSQRRHWTASSRDYYWSHIKKRVGYEGSVYLATRHFAGSQMINVLGLSSAEAAIALGHEDGGRLIEALYGHRDKRQTLARVVAAYDRRSNVVPLRIAEGT